jgi:hypothetical protein
LRGTTNGVYNDAIVLVVDHWINAATYWSSSVNVTSPFLDAVEDAVPLAIPQKSITLAVEPHKRITTMTLLLKPGNILCR